MMTTIEQTTYDWEGIPSRGRALAIAEGPDHYAILVQGGDIAKRLAERVKRLPVGMPSTRLWHQRDRITLGDSVRGAVNLADQWDVQQGEDLLETVRTTTARGNNSGYVVLAKQSHLQRVVLGVYKPGKGPHEGVA